MTDKLCGEDIPLIARIIAVADSFDAMTTDRPYRKAVDLEMAFEELRSADLFRKNGSKGYKWVEAILQI